jgi:outer membrane autotransporter protein
LQDTITLPSGATVQPYAKLNIWGGPPHNDRVSFSDGTFVVVDQKAAAVEYGGGVAAKLDANLGMWTTIGYTTSIANERLHGFGAGVRYTW